MGKRVVSYEEYAAMSDRDKLHVDVINFTGIVDDTIDLTGCGTLEERPNRSEKDGTLGSGGREQ